MKSKYLCDVVIIDNRGKQYASHFAGYWYPELGKTHAETKPWWKFWKRK